MYSKLFAWNIFFPTRNVFQAFEKPEKFIAPAVSNNRPASPTIQKQILNCRWLWPCYGTFGLSPVSVNFQQVFPEHPSETRWKLNSWSLSVNVQIFFSWFKFCERFLCQVWCYCSQSPGRTSLLCLLTELNSLGLKADMKLQNSWVYLFSFYDAKPFSVDPK